MNIGAQIFLWYPVLIFFECKSRSGITESCENCWIIYFSLLVNWYNFKAIHPHPKKIPRQTNLENQTKYISGLNLSTAANCDIQFNIYFLNPGGIKNAFLFIFLKTFLKKKLPALFKVVRAFEEQNRIVSGYKGRETSFKFEGFKRKKVAAWEIHYRFCSHSQTDRPRGGRFPNGRVLLLALESCYFWADCMDGCLQNEHQEWSTLYSVHPYGGLDHHSLSGNHSGLQSRSQLLIFFNYKVEDF